jgi:hypothetical protein
MEQLSETQLSNALLNRRGSRNKSETLHLAKVRFLPRHVNKEQFGDIAKSEIFLIFLNNRKGTAKDSLMTAISFWYYAL